MNKKVFIKTFGCQMNARDSEFVAGILLENGFALVPSPEKADVVLFNSCSVREHAERRLFGNIMDLQDLKETRPDLVIGLIGCTAQYYREKILEKLPIVDLVCGPGNEGDLPALIKDVLKNRCAIVATDKVDEKRPELFPRYRTERFRAYVSIGEGCNNFCSYCVVPYVRGRERSRDMEDIIREVKGLADRGCKEVMLLGQNVNSYGGKPSTRSLQPSAKKNKFVMLLEQLDRIKGIERIRFMTSHPKDASAGLFTAMRDLEKVCEHLHLPLQSGSDRVLALMNRGYTAGTYRRLIDAYRAAVPGGSLTTDFIVGFPSEKAGDFKKTLALVKDIRFDSAFLFKYSPRPPAKASRLKDDVSAAAKEKRLREILDTQRAISALCNRPLAGTTVDVLVDGFGGKDRTRVSGRTRTNKVVTFPGGTALVGKIVRVKIDEAMEYQLKGRKL